EWQVVSPWEVAWIGNDKKVNHCMLQRGELLMADPKPGAPSFVIVADREHTILRVRATDYRFTGKRMLAVTLVTADGAERTPLGAAATGPDLVDMELGKDRALLDRLAESGHVEVRLKGGTVRLPLDRLSEALAPYDRCMADIGKPAKGFSDAEIDALARQIAKGRAKCSENKRTRIVTCDVD
ncbi:MAG TPA: hypothetical protein VF031_11430, partial [Alphaproteobacteria bacterium]